MTPIAVVDEQQLLLAPLLGHWPVEELAGAHVVVVGAGSIGSAANDALAACGIGQLTLVDPDRLLTHNFARHRAHPRDVGRHKVNAERDRLTDRDPALRVDALPLDVIYDADAMRPLFAEADAVLIAADGIDARRAANHIARRAATPAIFACVLENGAYGEIIRTRPSQGCLLCARAELREEGGMAPERSLDRGYGRGTRHLPMTAVGGDLAVVGQLGAKIAVATILEANRPPRPAVARRPARHPAAPQARARRALRRRHRVGRPLARRARVPPGLRDVRSLGVSLPTVTILQEAEDRIRELAHESADGRETGGILLGRGPDAENVITVERAGDPGARAERRPDYFLRDLAHARELAADAWEETEAVWIGEWHTHPIGPPTPSTRDLVTYAGLLADADLSFATFVSIIVVPDPDWETARLLTWVLGSWESQQQGYGRT